MIKSGEVTATPIMKDVSVISVMLVVEGAEAIEEIKKAAAEWMSEKTITNLS